MTDNEIIKALECCVKGLECKNCPANPHKGNYGYCTSLLLKAALDLINRLQAQNDELYETIDYRADKITELEDKLKTAKAENERLRYNLEAVLDERADHSETIKEFAELSIKRICEEVSAPIPSESYIVEKCNQTIDNLLKEMESDN